MRVDRLSLEVSMRSAGYFVHVTTWDGVKGRLTHHDNYDKLSFNELIDVVYSVTSVLRPGTEFTVEQDHIVIQAPLFD